MQIKVTSHKAEVERELDKKEAMILNLLGLVAERYAKDLCPVDTGRLRNSISHTVSEDAVYIGTNVEYAVYQELGSSKRKAANNGRGFLRPAITGHLDEYRDIIEKNLKN